MATSNVPSRTVPAFAQASAAARRAGLAALMVVSVFLPRSPAAAQAVDRGISVIGGLAYGALSGALVGVSYVTLRANVWDRYVPGEDLKELAKNALTPWVIGGAIVSAAAIQIKFDDGASASRALRETLEGAVVGALAGWVMGLPHDKTAGAIIGLGAGALVSAAVILIDPGTSKDGREMGLFGGAPVLLFRWWF